MKYRFRVLLGLFSLLLVVSVGFNIVLAASGTTPEPGSDQDPLVSKSYVDSKVAANQQQLQQLQEEIAGLGGNPGAGSGGFEAVSIEAGKALYAGAGTEVILRSGKATALMGKDGGLADTTAAKDLAAGTTVAANHLLISARDDGRGFKTSNLCWAIIRGSYKIGQPPASTTPTTPTTPTSPGTTTEKGTVNTAVLNIRAEANTTAAILGKLVEGEVVDILSKSGEWYKIKTSKGITGWIMGTYVAIK